MKTLNAPFFPPSVCKLCMSARVRWCPEAYSLLSLYYIISFTASHVRAGAAVKWCCARPPSGGGRRKCNADSVLEIISDRLSDTFLLFCQKKKKISGFLRTLISFVFKLCRNPSHPLLKAFISHMSLGAGGTWEAPLGTVPRLPNHSSCEIGELTQTGESSASIYVMSLC